MAYSFNGRCYATPEDVTTAVTSSFPRVDSTGMASLSGAPTVSASGLLSYSVQTSPYAGGGSMTAQVVQLQPCTQTWADYPLSFVVFVVAVFFALAMGFSHGKGLA
ncbi:hypothetical protein AZSI13_07640 [Azospira sp. I13]|uniref:hypothetical protein n=1 Tax=Azospira sp. I13 TaxID=1765050 RepID=UPI000D41830A|nr:hypothetical protein [Azospira sp. I13]GBG01437.1 hypothetical protein AZSI13_07640 [Azospira sp. I13]